MSPRFRLAQWCTLTFLFFVLATASLVAAATPQKIFAVVSQNVSGNGNPKDSVKFFDVTDIEAGGASGVFTDSDTGFSNPLFSVWLGYESVSGDAGGGVPTGDDEDPGAITVNHVNGTVYVSAFDSGTPAAGFPFDPDFNPDASGDMQGDWDLFRIDYQEILDDFVSNSRPKGTVYGPRFQPITISNESFLNTSGSPLFDGTVDGMAENIPHPDSLIQGNGVGPTVIIDNAILKVGELGRSQQSSSVGSFFDTEIDFIDPETLLVLDTATGDTGPAEDFQIRIWNRISTSPGNAAIDSDGPDNIRGNADDQQGGRNGEPGSPAAALITESWHATIAGRLDMDTVGTPSKSDPTGVAIVNQAGVLGIWVVESDNSDYFNNLTQGTIGPNEPNDGDDISFYQLDLSGPTPSVTKKSLFGTASGDSIRASEDPTSDPTTDDGDIEFVLVDKDGNLIVGETGYFDTVTGSATFPLGLNGETAEEPRVFTVGIGDYDDPTNGVIPAQGTGFEDLAAWTANGEIPVTGGIDNDDYVTDIRRVAYDKGTGFIYIIDEDGDEEAGSEVADPEDLYVFDPATGTIVYSELGATNLGFFNADTQLIFLRGDVNNDGLLTSEDVAQMTAAIADPTQGGKFSSAVGQEFYDLTGDGLLTDEDLTELKELIGTTPGDFNGDGNVTAADYTAWRDGLGTAFTPADYDVWKANFGITAAASVTSVTNASVPEPSSALLLMLTIAAASSLRVKPCFRFLPTGPIR